MYLLVIGVSVDAYPHIIVGAHCFTSSTAKFNWRLLKIETMQKKMVIL